MSIFKKATLFLLVLFFRIAEASKPNIILIVDDEHNRRYMGWTGLERVINTPNLDRLASQSVAFTHGYATVPQCGPTRHSLYTGRYASEHGVLKNDLMLRAGVPLLQDLLSQAGYTTANIGKIHAAPYNLRMGFQYVLNHEFYQDASGISHFWPYLADQVAKRGIVSTRFPTWNFTPQTWQYTDAGLAFMYDLPADLTSEHWVTTESLNFLNDQITNRKGKPFFLHASYFGPHPPFGPTKTFDTFSANDVHLPDSWSQNGANNFLADQRQIYNLPALTSNEFKDIKARYLGFISQVDFEVGRLLSWLDSHPDISANTIVIFLSDHGDMMGERGMLFKGLMWEGAVGVPFMIKWPGIKPRHESVPVSHIDIMPTLLSAAGIKLPAKLPGNNLKPLLDTTSPGTGWLHRPIISEYFLDTPFPWGMLMAVQNNYKLIATRLSQKNMDFSYKLYNLQLDPWELNNLADNPAYSVVLRQLKTLLNNHIAKQMPFLPLAMPPKVPRCTWNIQLPYNPWQPVTALHCP